MFLMLLIELTISCVCFLIAGALLVTTTRRSSSTFFFIHQEEAILGGTDERERDLGEGVNQLVRCNIKELPTKKKQQETIAKHTTITISTEERHQPTLKKKLDKEQVLDHHEE